MALDLPERERAELATWRDELIAGRRELRAVAEEALHMTLAFLGYRPEKEIAAISEAIRSGLPGATTVEFLQRRVVSVPIRRPRLFALELEDVGERGRALQRALSDALAARGFYEPEQRPWWPHVTLARVKRHLRAEPLEGEFPPTKPLRPPRVTLYRSVLRPQGAEYEPLAMWPLG